jgi:hypothetical protein
MKSCQNATPASRKIERCPARSRLRAVLGATNPQRAADGLLYILAQFIGKLPDAFYLKSPPPRDAGRTKTTNRFRSEHRGRARRRRGTKRQTYRDGDDNADVHVLVRRYLVVCVRVGVCMCARG